MALHVEYVDAELPANLHRQGTHGATLDAALDSTERALEHQDILAAWMLEAESGNTGFGKGRMVAVYTPTRGWQKLQTDPRPWWEALSAETRQHLLERLGLNIPGKYVSEILSAGGQVIRAYFVQSEGAEAWAITHPLRDFVESMQYRDHSSTEGTKGG
ncbi:hypothetical protein [Nesterenkonia muleiensis]|uniref:hypothetical protein n=1 Tax=Nesterenkonia muleiensis TaxID=2282648 RepID=UPI000E75688E|nr:hypothetical protein [Nesterenkonia muleiensis]